MISPAIRWLPWSGWLILLALCWFARDRISARVERYWNRVDPAVELQSNLERRKFQLERETWLDPRPLVLMLGDSQVEMGDWNQLLRGAVAVRNAGVSRATTSQVRGVAEAAGADGPAVLLLFCGINDLGPGAAVPSLMADYARLLEAARRAGKTAAIVVISIMPVEARTPANKDVNARVREANLALRELAGAHGAVFVDIVPAVSRGGGLRKEYSSDGLHLNPAGYAAVAEVLRPVLMELAAAACEQHNRMEKDHE